MIEPPLSSLAARILARELARERGRIRALRHALGLIAPEHGHIHAPGGPDCHDIATTYERWAHDALADDDIRRADGEPAPHDAG